MKSEQMLIGSEVEHMTKATADSSLTHWAIHDQS